MSYNDIRPIFERVWDHVNTFIPIWSEVEKGSSKPSKRETSKIVEEEKVEKEDVKPNPLMSEKKAVRTRRKTLARRRASDKQVEDSLKRQKKEKESDDFEQEKKDLRMWLSVLNDEEEFVTPEFLYSLFRRLDRDDLKVLYKLVQEIFEDHSLEEKELILWGDLRMMFDPDEQDEIWKNQESWKVLRWRLYENLGVHSVFLIDTPMEINMLVEKKYPLKKEILEKMINLKLQAKDESTMAFELIKVFVIKSHNKTPYELIRGRTPLIDFMKPFGCPVTILNTRDHLGKFDGKADEGFFVGYYVVSKAMRVFNKRTKIVEETLNIRFLENAPNVTGNIPDWLFDADSLTKSMNYVPIVAENQTNGIAGTRDNIVAGQAEKKIEPEQEYILIPFYTTDPLISQGPKDSEEDVSMKPTEVNESRASDKGEEDEQDTRILLPSSPVNDARTSEEHLFEQFSPFKNAFTLPDVPNVFSINDTGIFGNAYDDEDVGAAADLNNLETTMNVSPILTTRIDKDHPKDQIIGDLTSSIQTRRMTKISNEHVMVSYINKQRRTNHKDYQNCLFACFLSQNEPKKVIQALEDPSWIKAMQEELLQFQLQKVWTLVDLPNSQRAIGTKWVFRNKKDERGIVIRNKARLVAQGYTQEEGIDYDEVFAPVARIESIKLFLVHASYMGFIVYQMDVKSAFLYGTIEEEVYVCQPPSFEDPHFPNKVYKVQKALYGLHQAPRAWYKTLSTYLNENRFRRGTIDKTLFIKKDKGDIFQDKYVAEILKKFDFATVKTSSTPIETNKELVKDEEAKAIDVHLYRSMIRTLMYLTAFRPDIMFAICACVRFQVTPKTSHIHDVKRIFRYLKDSDYVGASLDRKSTTGGCQFLGKRLISWQCKKQTIVANSTTEAEYVAAANCCEQDNLLIPNPHPHLLNSIIKKPIIIPSSYQHKKTHKPRKAIRTTKISQSSGPINLVVDETVYKEWEDRMEKAATTASSLDAEQDSGSGPRVYTLGSGEDSMKLLDLMELCTKLSDLATTKVNTVNGQRQIQALVDKKKVIITETSIRSDLHLEDADGTDCLPTATIFEELARMGAKSTSCNEFSSTMASAIICLATTQKFNLSKYIFDAMTPITTQLSISKPQEKQSRRKQKKNIEVPFPSDSTADVPNEEHVPTHSNDPLLSGEDRMKLTKLMDMCTKLFERVFDLEHTKTTQAQEITNLKLRVKKLEKKAEDASKKRRSRIKAIDRDAKVTLVETQRRNDENDDNLMFDTGVFDGDEIVVETEEPMINAATTTKLTLEKDVVQESSENVSTTTKMVSTATIIVVATPAITTPPQQRAKGIGFREPVESTITTTVPSLKSKDKGKVIMIEPKKPLKKKYQIELDEELAREIEAEEQAELERIQKERVAQG
ncbi:putative ribonuclease H-like domain-containing protein [Tanacetum coccineum]